MVNSVLSFSHLGYEVTVKSGASRKLLDDVSVEIKAGELLAIMVNTHTLIRSFTIETTTFPGPVRCRQVLTSVGLDKTWRLMDDTLQGKSTLLDVMAFRKRSTGESIVSLVLLEHSIIHLVSVLTTYMDRCDWITVSSMLILCIVYQTLSSKKTRYLVSWPSENP